MITSKNSRIRKLFRGADPVVKVYVGMTKIFPDIVLAASPETHTFSYQNNQSVVFSISTENFEVVSKPSWITTTVAGNELTAKTNAEHNTSTEDRSGQIVIASTEDRSITLAIPVAQHGNVYISSTTTRETWSSGWRCIGCDDVRDYEWQYVYHWTDGSKTYSAIYSGTDRDSNWQNCVSDVGSTCTTEYGGWSAKTYGNQQSSCSGSTETITTPWSRSRSVTEVCRYTCTGAVSSSTSKPDQTETGNDTQTITNSSNCVKTLLYTERCYSYTYNACVGTTATYRESITITEHYSDGSSIIRPSTDTLRYIYNACVCRIEPNCVKSPSGYCERI